MLWWHRFVKLRLSMCFTAHIYDVLMRSRFLLRNNKVENKLHTSKSSKTQRKSLFDDKWMTGKTRIYLEGDVQTLRSRSLTMMQKETNKQWVTLRFLLLSAPDYVPFKVCRKKQNLVKSHEYSHPGERVSKVRCVSSSLFILSARRGDLSPVGYSAVMMMMMMMVMIIIIIRRIIGTPEAESPHELTDHHRVNSSAPPLLSVTPFICADIRTYRKRLSPLILPMKSPISRRYWHLSAHAPISA